MDNTIPDAYSRIHTMEMKRYKKMKIRMLTEDFRLKLTEEEINHFNELTSEISIDRYAKELMNKRWDN